MRQRLPKMLVVLLCLAVLAVGVWHKEGYHMDELLSFELANARFTPWIVPTQPEGRLEKFVKNEIEGDSAGETFGNLAETVKDVLQNRGGSKMLSYKADVYEEPVWISAEEFREYITVDKGDDFQYLSVYFNVKDDNHPPVHFMLLHTMSSLWKGTVSPFLGCFINLVAVAGILILLMGLGRRLMGPEQGTALGVLAALLYGLSAGAMATTLLIRMYALVAFFCVAFFFIHVQKWQEEAFGQKNKLLILVTVLGFLTQYFFLFYCLLLAAVTGVLLAASKRYKELFRYVRSMVTAAVIGVALFPFSVSDVFSSGRGVEALNNLSEGFSGYGARLKAFYQILEGRTFGVLFTPLLLAALLLFWYAIFSKKPLWEQKQKGIWWMLCIPVPGYFLLVSRMSPYLVDRYMMPIFPFVILLVSALLMQGLAWLLPERMAGRERGKQAVILAVGGLLTIWQFAGILHYDGTYLYTGYAAQEAVARAYSDVPCICVYEGVGYYENLIEFTSYEKTLLVKPEELSQRRDKESVTSLDRVVVLLKPGVDDAGIAQTMQEEYGFTLEKWLFLESVHGDRAALFTKATAD
ncbi:MAG: hypothetical protein J6C84_01610 [Lachnospiraceae bacterium]|nr:hypothetical protein [Lachnospiraceae bacterium]